MPLSAVINNGYNRQIVLLWQTVICHNEYKQQFNVVVNINESYQIIAQCIILPNRFQFLIKI